MYVEACDVSAENPDTAFLPNGCSAANFSRFLSNVAQASSAGRFHRPPLGPLGSHLTLADDKWAAAVEIAIGRALSTFVVHDFDDQKLLKARRTCTHMCTCMSSYTAHGCVCRKYYC